MVIALDDSRMLDTWDRAASLARPWRELALLESASGIPAGELASLSIGERDRLLLALRIGTFGNHLECETRCPSCGARLELAFDASSLMVPALSVDDHDFEIAVDDRTVRFRLPDSNDVAAALAGDKLEARLVDRSFGEVQQPWRESDPSSLAPERGEGSHSLREKLAERIAALDPQADLSLDLTCAACEHRWQAAFDPAEFLFREVESYVARLTNEVHMLARAYAWSEESILAMGASRRRRYLNLVTQ